MRKRRSAARRKLTHVRKALERLNVEKVATVDLMAPRVKVMKDLEREISALDLTEEHAPALDTIIDGHAATWRQTVERRRHSGLAAIDHLEADVRALVAELSEVRAEKQALLTEIQAVKANVYDQVGEPEQPKIDWAR